MRSMILLQVLIISFLLLSCTTAEAQTGKTKVKQSDYQLQQIKQKVQLNQPQITKIYTRESAIYAQGGMLKITLYITEKGKVADAEVQVTSGKFTSTLIKAVKAKIMEWKFDNKTKMVYTFSFRLSKN